MKDEKAVKAKVKKLLDLHGWFWFMPPANGFGKAGISDIIAIKAGVFLAIETKFGSNKPTALQKGFLESINAEGGFGFVVNEKNIHALDSFLSDMAGQTAEVAQNQRMSNDAGARMVDALRALQALI